MENQVKEHNLEESEIKEIQALIQEIGNGRQDGVVFVIKTNGEMEDENVCVNGYAFARQISKIVLAKSFMEGFKVSPDLLLMLALQTQNGKKILPSEESEEDGGK